METTIEGLSSTVESQEMKNENIRIEFEFLEYKIPVTFREDFSGFKFSSISINPATKGTNDEIPLYIAEFLFRKGIIEDYTKEYPTQLQDLTTALRNEVRSGELQKLHPFFYFLITPHLDSSEKQDSRFNELETKRLISAFIKLSTERVSKIIKMTEWKDINIQKSNLTVTEQVFYQQLRTIIKTWKKEFVKLS
ncbi:hypothetical protein [Candidatus Hodarchaeum mangrovi]